MLKQSSACMKAGVPYNGSMWQMGAKSKAKGTSSLPATLTAVLRIIERGNIKEGWLDYFPRSSFDILQGCTDSGPGRFRIPEVTWTELMCCTI